MAARATRSTTWAARLGTLPHARLLQLAADALTELPEDHAEALAADHERSRLLVLSHDLLGKLFDGLADPLQPFVAVAFSSTCKGLRTPPVLEQARMSLMQRYFRALALCRKLKLSCAELLDAEVIGTDSFNSLGLDCDLTADDVATLGMVLRTSGLPRLQRLSFRPIYGDAPLLGDAPVQALCEGLGCGGAPSLKYLDIGDNGIGLPGAEALAAVLLKGTMPKLGWLRLDGNPIGSRGVAVLAAPLRKLPALEELYLCDCEIGDKGVAPLVANLGKDDFKALNTLHLYGNNINRCGREVLKPLYLSMGYTASMV